MPQKWKITCLDLSGDMAICFWKNKKVENKTYVLPSWCLMHSLMIIYLLETSHFLCELNVHCDVVYVCLCMQNMH